MKFVWIQLFRKEDVLRAPRILSTLASIAKLLCVAAATVGVASAAVWPGWADLPAESVIRQSYGDEDAVILFDQWEISVKGGTRTGTHRRVSRLLTENGRADIAMTLARGPFDSYSKVKVWVREPSGRTRAFDEEQGTLFSFSSRRELDDTEILLLEPRSVPPGSTIAVEYRFRSLPDIPQDFLAIQGPVPVRHAAVKIDAHGGWRVVAKVAGGANPGPENVSDDGTWDFSDLPGRPASAEWMAPAPPRLTLVLDYLPAGQDSEFRDWGTTARWGAALFPADALASPPTEQRMFQDSPPGTSGKARPEAGAMNRPPDSQAPSVAPTLESETARLRTSGGDPVEIVGKMVRALRYFAIEIGWGGYRPRPPETTLARGFGDCKDKSALMVACLRRLGVEAFPVLAVAPMFRTVPDSVPGPRYFNHCVVGIPWKGRQRSAGMSIIETEEFGPLRIFDPTLSEASGQDTHYAYEGGAVLPLDPRTKHLLRLPRTGEGENRSEEVSHWRLDGDGTLGVRTAARFQGVARTYLEGEGEDLLTNRELRRRVFGAASRIHPHLETFEITNIRREGEGAWTYEMSYRSRESLARFGHLVVLALPPIHDPSLFPIPDGKKSLSQYHAYLETFHDMIDLEFAGRELIDLPEGFETTNALGSVSLVVRREDDHLIMERTAVTRELEISPDKREQARELQSALRRANAISVVLAAAAQPGQEPNQER